MIVTFCFHNSILFCCIPHATFDMLQQQETLYFGYKNVGSHVQLQICKSNSSCRQRRMRELILLRQFLPGMDCNSDWLTIGAGTACHLSLVLQSLFFHLNTVISTQHKIIYQYKEKQQQQISEFSTAPPH